MSDPEIPQSFTPEIVILGVSFDDDYAALQITYVEARNVSKHGFKQDTITISADALDKAELADVVESITSFVEAGLLSFRLEGPV